MAHKCSVCAHSRLLRTTPLFLSPFLCLEGSIEEMADLSVSADRSVCSGREWTHSLCHPHSHSTRSLSCRDFIREGNTQIHPNCCFSSSAGGRSSSTSLGPRDSAVSVHTGAECRHNPSGLLSTNPANERTASEPPGECP